MQDVSFIWFSDDTGCKRMADGLSMLLTHWPGALELIA